MSRRPNNRAEQRRNRYKVAVDAGDGRRRREDGMISVRKSRREENFLKKRREGRAQQDIGSIKEHLENLQGLAATIWTNEDAKLLAAAKHLRKSLSIGTNPPIQEKIEAGLVPQLVEFLKRDDFPDLQFEAVWALSYISSGKSEHTAAAIVASGAIPLLVKLLSSPNEDFREPAVLALGDVAGESPKFRDIVIGHGVLSLLLAQLDDNAKLSFIKRATWTLTNLCRGQPESAFDQIRQALPVLQKLLRQSTDEEVIVNICWVLSHLSDGTEDAIQVVIDSGLCRRLVEFMDHPSASVAIPALGAVGNILTGDDQQTQSIINCGALQHFRNFLIGDHDRDVKEQALWALSNITAGNLGHIQAVIEADIIGGITQLAQHGDFGVKREAAWVLANVATYGTPDHVRYIVSQQYMKSLCDYLVFPDPSVIMVCLQALERILDLSQTNGTMMLCTQMIDEAEGRDRLEDLLNHGNEEIHTKALEILETYWMDGEDN